MKLHAWLIYAAACGLFSPLALAADSTASDTAGATKPWAVQVTSYVWAAGLRGDVSPFRRGPVLQVDKSFSETLSNLSAAGFVNGWARQQRYVASGDLMYVNTSSKGGTGELPAFHLPVIGVEIPAGGEIDGKIRTQQFMATLLGGYRVIDSPKFTLDTLAGARFWHISNKASVTVRGPSTGAISHNYREDFHWLDPVLGVRTFAHLTEQLSIQAQADIGGFGAGAKLTWSALATVNYVFSPKLSLSAGYKVVKVDYDRNGYVYDARLAGPVLGLTYRF